jgi:hypothetical protein
MLKYRGIREKPFREIGHTCTGCSRDDAARQQPNMAGKGVHHAEHGAR